MQLKSRIIAALSVSLLVTVASVGIVVAQNVAQDNETTTTQQTETTELSLEQRDLQQRLEERKLTRPNNVSEFQQSRIRARCKAAQQRITNLGTQITTREANRQQRYEVLTSKLEQLDQSLQAGNASIGSLSVLRAELVSLTGGFMAVSSKYKLAVSDLMAMDCEQEPDVFQLTLEAARGYQSETKAVAEEIKLFLQTKLKPTLIDLKNNL